MNRYKILMICTNPTFKYKKGGTKQVLDGLVELCGCSNDVVFLTALSHKDKNYLPNIGNTYYFKQWTCLGYHLALFTDFNLHFWSKFRKVVRREKIDLIFITMAYGVISVSFICPNIPIIYDSHGVMGDVASITFATLERKFRIFKVPFIKNIVKSLLQGNISLIERLVCNRAAHIKAISEPDRQRFVEKYDIDKDKITVIPPFINPHEFQKTSSEKRTLEKTSKKIEVVFHGSYAHPPNYDAFQLILNYIAPEVGKRNSSVYFLLAGPSVPIFERPHVKSLGFVEDLQTLLANSDIAIVPLLMGEGAKIKVFDYMAAGLPIISTKKGIRAIKAESNKHAIILDAVDQRFIDAIIDLADDPNKREILGRNAFELARVKYSQESMQVKLDEMLIKVIKSKKSNTSWV